MVKIKKVNHSQNIMTIAVVMFLAVIAGGVIMIANNTYTPKTTNKAAELSRPIATGIDKISPELPLVSPTPPVSNPIAMTWYGSYFNDSTTTHLHWDPANLVHQVNPETFQFIDFDWTSIVSPFPDMRVPYSTTWWGNTPILPAGTYRFCIRQDDHLDVWIQAGPHNNKNQAPLVKVIEGGVNGRFTCTAATGTNRDKVLGGGYNITVNYYEDPAVSAFGAFYFAKL